MKRSKQDVTQQVLLTIRKFLFEIGNETALRILSPDAYLDKDLGIGSIERTELFHRVEKVYDIQFPDKVLLETASVKDIIEAVLIAKPKTIHLAKKNNPLINEHNDRSFISRNIDRCVSTLCRNGRKSNPYLFAR